MMHDHDDVAVLESSLYPVETTHEQLLLTALPALPLQKPKVEKPLRLPSNANINDGNKNCVTTPETAAQDSLTAADHRVIISAAMSIPDESERDAALISALRGCSSELEAAEDDHARATKRLADAREMFDWATAALSGYSKILEPKSEKLRTRGRKRKGEEGDGDYDEKLVAPDEGPLLPPMVATSGGGLTEEQVAAHRDEFYMRLCDRPFSELHSYTPPAHLANMKNRAQLDECIFIAEHWETGLEDMDVMSFRRQHKSFYTKMKLSSENIGRRTGHHLRNLAGGDGKKVFCRYGKSGESLMYISVEELYDAIFEIHSLKGHRGWQGCKKLANLKYANLPQDQIRYFVETCPICCERKSKMNKKHKGEDEFEDIDAEV